MSTEKSNDLGADTDISNQDVGHVHDSKGNEKQDIVEKGPGRESPTSSGNDLPEYQGEEDYGRRRSTVVDTAEGLVTRVIDVEDDPTLNPWTFRTFFLGTSKEHILACDMSEQPFMRDGSTLS